MPNFLCWVLQRRHHLGDAVAAAIADVVGPETQDLPAVVGEDEVAPVVVVAAAAAGGGVVGAAIDFNRQALTIGYDRQVNTPPGHRVLWLGLDANGFESFAEGAFHGAFAGIAVFGGL